MDAKRLRQLYLDFFSHDRGHTIISGAPLIPSNDPSVLFTTAGMQPLIAFLLSWQEMDVNEAKQSGAIGLFEDRYGERVKVYRIGDFSMEICGGPHVDHTGQLGQFKIIKEEAVSAGIRRIRGMLMS